MTYSIDLANILENFGNEGKIVGFANKYFTLWTYKITKNEANGELTFDAYFVKNLGNTNRFAEIYPFDENLKGVELHITSGREGTGLNLTPQQLKALKFSRGPQRGLNIADYTNLSSLIWKYNTKHVKPSLSEARKEAELTNIANRAIELGAVIYENLLWRAEELDTTLLSKNPEFQTRIADINDDNLLCWKYNHEAVNQYRPEPIWKEELENIKARAIELGAIELNGRLYSTKAQQEPWFVGPRQLLNALELGEEVDFEAQRNLEGDGTYNVSSVITLVFEHKYYPATYYGPAHCYPVDRKGKGKIIRNKVLHIKKAEKIEGTTTPTFKIIDWEFAK